MDDRADRKRPDETQQPGDQQNDGDGIQHGDFSSITSDALSMLHSQAGACALEYRDRNIASALEEDGNLNKTPADEVIAE
jgi:hypothetical protein